MRMSVGLAGEACPSESDDCLLCDDHGFRGVAKGLDSPFVPRCESALAPSPSHAMTSHGRPRHATAHHAMACPTAPRPTRPTGRSYSMLRWSASCQELAGYELDVEQLRVAAELDRNTIDQGLKELRKMSAVRNSYLE